MRISDWSSDVCSSDLGADGGKRIGIVDLDLDPRMISQRRGRLLVFRQTADADGDGGGNRIAARQSGAAPCGHTGQLGFEVPEGGIQRVARTARRQQSSEEHTSELHSLIRFSYAVFCWTTKTHYARHNPPTHTSNNAK